MTEKLKPSSLAEALFYADWPEGDDKWEQHNKKGPDAAARRYMRLAEVAAAWNTRATGWRTDWENAHTQNLLRVCRYISASYIWVYAYAFKNQKDTWITESGNILHWTPTHFQEITPPDSEAPHD